jgi:hypothetical protein
MKEWIIEQRESPYRIYWVILDPDTHNIVWIEYTKGECERVIKDGTLQKALDECMVMCYNGKEDY